MRKLGAFFPAIYIFIKSEFPLHGIVRTSGSSGRIDILAFNPSSNKLAVFELKRDFSRNIRDQAGDYRDKIVSHFHEIYLRCTQDYDIQLPKYKTLNQDTIETVLVSNSFSPADIEKVNNFKNDNITLIKYSWFERDLLFIEYLNNVPIDSISSNINYRQNEGAKRNEVVKQSQNIETFNPVNDREQRNSILTLKTGDFVAKGYETGVRKEFIVLAGSGISSTVTAHISKNEKKIKRALFQ